MVGRAVCEHCMAAGDQVLPYDHKSLDISDRDRVRQVFQTDRPEIVINCAAWTDVDGCELDREHAFAANSRGPENLATASREMEAGLVTISTDYVFDGRKEGFYTQREQPKPESIYGASKLDGERRAQMANARTIVVRTGFIFGLGGRNFLSTVVELARRGVPLKAIVDAWGTPTYAPDLASRLRELAILGLPGVFHVVNSGPGASYEEFARAALQAAGCDQTNLEAVTMGSLNRPAPRPSNSRLKCLISEAIGLEPLPNWKDALRAYIASQKRAEIATQS
jgi:dTDP-4-dehydrorhamnose reductase